MRIEADSRNAKELIKLASEGHTISFSPIGEYRLSGTFFRAVIPNECKSNPDGRSWVGANGWNRVALPENVK